jgi:hypothetical protein
LFDFLQNRELVDIILSAEVIFAAVFTISIFIAVHALLGFMRQSGDLYTRLAHIDAELNVLHASIPGKLERITAMRQQLHPLRTEFEQIQKYYSRLQHIDRKWQEEQMEKERQEEDDKDGQIQRQRLGLDRFL